MPSVTPGWPSKLHGKSDKMGEHHFRCKAVLDKADGLADYLGRGLVKRKAK